jgi:Family of unknown function (DUF6282)
MISVNPGRLVRSLALLTCAAMIIIGRPAGAGLQSSAGGAADAVTKALDGAFDIHVHSFPDNVERSIDALEVSILSRSRAMRGLVLKNHYDPTSGLAYMVRKQVGGLEVFGGVDLNLPVGGMNAAAVEHMARPRRVDVDVRRGEPGSLRERQPTLRQCLPWGRSAAGHEGRHRCDRKAWIGPCDWSRIR